MARGNPYHDEKGRFTSGYSDWNYNYDEKTSVELSKTINAEYNRMKKLRATKDNIDKWKQYLAEYNAKFEYIPKPDETSIRPESYKALVDSLYDYTKLLDSRIKEYEKDKIKYSWED